VEELPYNLTDEELILHSLKKWTGVLPENLKKHEVQYRNWKVSEKENIKLSFGDGTCSLCHRYYVRTCKKTCPIIKTQGTNCHAIWAACHKKGKPMIELLEKTLEFIKKEVVDNSAKL